MSSFTSRGVKQQSQENFIPPSLEEPLQDLSHETNLKDLNRLSKAADYISDIRTRVVQGNPPDKHDVNLPVVIIVEVLKWRKSAGVPCIQAGRSLIGLQYGELSLFESLES